MDTSENDKFELEKRNANPVSYQPPTVSSDWRFSGANLTNTTASFIPADNQVAIGTCASTSMVGSFGPNPWEHPSSSENLGFCDINVQNSASTSNSVGIGKASPAFFRGNIDRPFDMTWNPPGSVLKGGVFLSNAPGILPQSLSQFPADSAFIERAARFSSFNGENFTDMVNALGIPETMGLYSRDPGLMQGPQEVYNSSGLRSVSSQSQKIELIAGKASKTASLQVESRATDGSPLKNERKSESLGRSTPETKQGVGGSGNESDEAEFGGSGTQEDPSALNGTHGELSARGLGLKKRKRSGQDAELDLAKGGQQPSEAAKDNADDEQKGDQNPTTTTNKTIGKQGKQGSQASDPLKEEYVHVRARRGQATNSHSLAERVRREKISERMKFLQDLVPGCSKVTGKAVMLDEIINYVQSLQRQVEFLSMKLATVNPRLDFNVEGLLAKDILQSRAGPSSTLGFNPDISMNYPPLHPTHSGVVQTVLPVMGSPTDFLRRSISSQLTPMPGGFKDSSQLPNAWEEDLHNVVQMNYGTRAPPDSEDINGHMKSEL